LRSLLQNLNRYVIPFRLALYVGTLELNLAALSIPDSRHSEDTGNAKGSGFSCAEHAPPWLALFPVDDLAVHLKIAPKIVPAHAAPVVVDGYPPRFDIDMDIDDRVDAWIVYSRPFETYSQTTECSCLNRAALWSKSLATWVVTAMAASTTISPSPA
jgi:hypothetical protein